MLTFTDEKLQQKLSEKYKADASGLRFYSFPNLEANVKNQIDKIKSTPFLPTDIPVHGFVYDVRTGKIKQVSAAAQGQDTSEEEIQQIQEIGNKIRISTK